MDDFKTIYKILKYLRDAMDFSTPDLTPITAEQLGIAQERRNRLMCILQDGGYIKGLHVTAYYADPEHKL